MLEDRTGAGRAMDLLHAHVPLALLVDLAADPPLSSRDLMEEEGHPDSQWWLIDVREPDSGRGANFSAVRER